MESAQKFKAVLTDFKQPYLDEVSAPELGEGQVLIKVEAAPINPSDQFYVSGHYGVKDTLNEPPTGVGFEGAGTIVDAHESAKDVIGKKAAFFEDCSKKEFQGSWRQYIVKNKSEILIFSEDIEAERISSSFVNPITAAAMVDVAKTKGHKALIHSAASSSLGKMLVKHANDQGVPLINIVRRDEQVKTLQDLGAEYVLNSTSETFEADLKELAHKLEATGFFDAVTGDLTRQVLNSMPVKSTAYVYGGLAGKPISLSALDFIFYEKTVSYLWLGPFLRDKSSEDRKQIFDTITNDLASGGKIFGSDVVRSLPLSEFEEGLKEYRNVASDGKIVLRPHD